jgi:RHS repeat-associated protein
MESAPKSNRMIGDTLLQMQYQYFADGARDQEFSTRDAFQNRWYYYDGLGRMTGTVNWYHEDDFFGLSDNAHACRYDADGQLAKPCANLSQWLAFDGPNVSGAANQTNVVRWRFVHGPGVDDPLMGMHEDGGDRWSFFWLTDGQGREYGVSDSTNDQGGYRAHFLGHGGNYAGGTSAAASFAADRFGTPQVPKVSFFRNRAYDQQTGRWTQEDPIGLAGGINLYQFNGNNPVMYSDPFGLCPWCVGAVAGVATGFAIAMLTGDDYSLKDVAVDAAIGAVGGGIVNKLGKLNSLRKGAALADDAGDIVKGSSKARKTLADHVKKLEDYKANPDAYDNKGFLQNAPSQQIRERIIQKRIKHLEDEIRAIRKAIDETN